MDQVRIVFDGVNGQADQEALAGVSRAFSALNKRNPAWGGFSRRLDRKTGAAVIKADQGTPQMTLMTDLEKVLPNREVSAESEGEVCVIKISAPKTPTLG